MNTKSTRFERLVEEFRARPLWINALLLFCLYMALVYVPWDLLFKPLARDQEVWFGWVFHGWMAKAGALAHWFVYAAGTWGFWKMRPWIWTWSAAYTLQVAFSMCVWQTLDSRGAGLPVGLAVALPFVLLAIALLRARRRFGPGRENGIPAKS